VELPTLLLLAAVGCVTGLLAGLFGVGGGIVLVPILLWFYTSFMGVPAVVAGHLTLGTSLFIIVLTSLSSASKHYKNGHVVLKAAGIIGVVSIVSAAAGSQIAGLLPGRVLLKLFAVVLTLTAIQLAVGSGPRDVRKMEMNLSGGGMALTGLVSGLLSSLTGLGGGVVSIPMMHSMLGFPMKSAVGTSSATIVLTAAAAAGGYVYSGWDHPDLVAYQWFTLGYVDFLHSLPVIAGTLPSAILGAHLAHRMRSALLRKLFACLLLAVALGVFFFE
jgi:uncharacterized membrane protein YfcA